MVEEVKLSVPLKFRRGALRHEEARSVAQGVEMLKRIGQSIPLKDKRILDFGCGVKISQALYQMDSPQSLYVGVDVYKGMIEFLQKALGSSPKYKFAAVPFRNEMYNPEGEVMTPASSLPIDESDFDVAMMFSVITHMNPEDASAVFQILRRYMKQDGRLIFWAFASDENKVDFRDNNPDKPLLHAVYRKAFLDEIIRDAGWTIVKSDLGKERDEAFKRQTHYVCTPA